MTDTTTLRNTLAATLNCASRESVSNTPDFILAQYMLDCLAAFEVASLRREKWYGRSLSINGDKDLGPEAPVEIEEIV